MKILRVNEVTSSMENLGDPGRAVLKPDGPVDKDTKKLLRAELNRRKEQNNSDFHVVLLTDLYVISR